MWYLQGADRETKEASDFFRSISGRFNKEKFLFDDGRRKDRMSLKELIDICVDWSLNNKEVFCDKPYPTKPTKRHEEIAELFEWRVQAWKEQKDKIQNENDVNIKWLEYCEGYQKGWLDEWGIVVKEGH